MKQRHHSLAGIIGGAGLLCLTAAALGLTFNAIRPGGIPLMAPFPYQQDCPEKNKPAGPTLSASRAIELSGIPSTLFIDARPEEAFKQVHIAGARSLPFSFIDPIGAEMATQLKSYRQLIVYCDSPSDTLAKMQAEQLRKLGLESVRVLQGGMAGYQRAITHRESHDER